MLFPPNEIALLLLIVNVLPLIDKLFATSLGLSGLITPHVLTLGVSGFIQSTLLTPGVDLVHCGKVFSNI